MPSASSTTATNTTTTTTTTTTNRYSPLDVLELSLLDWVALQREQRYRRLLEKFAGDAVRADRVLVQAQHPQLGRPLQPDRDCWDLIPVQVDLEAVVLAWTA